MPGLCPLSTRVMKYPPLGSLLLPEKRSHSYKEDALRLLIVSPGLYLQRKSALLFTFSQVPLSSTSTVPQIITGKSIFLSADWRVSGTVFSTLKDSASYVQA